MFSGVFVFPNTPGSAFQLLRNVTSGSFLEADQQREINVPPPPYACNTALCRIIDEGCDILQKIPPLFNHEEGTFRGIWADVAGRAGTPEFPILVVDYRFSHMQSESTKVVYFWRNLICISFMLWHPSQITQENNNSFLYSIEFSSDRVWLNPSQLQMILYISILIITLYIYYKVR